MTEEQSQQDEQQTAKQEPARSQENTSEDTAQGQSIDQVTGVAAVAYLLFFLPLITNRDNEFAMYHANQGLLLLLTSVVINTIGTIIPILGWFILLPLGNIFVIVLFFMGVIRALNGQKKPLPLIGGFDVLK